ncbi:hypothetical protein TNIN_149361 [Trichonephila inaurata madagascariensis]|uniref:Uncharacterized protein n=1 Tax=Trichonephila inaurata madagascariensis TaxID=2747483 RepID=A0A8X6IT95_9ARAC|nr:hypothetical protein TNIN_149361 [Trichonephila inaurata madagascariensis]
MKNVPEITAPTLSRGQYKSLLQQKNIIARIYISLHLMNRIKENYLFWGRPVSTEIVMCCLHSFCLLGAFSGTGFASESYQLLFDGRFCPQRSRYEGSVD